MLRRKIMVLYLSVVFIAMSVIAILNICLGTYNFDNYQLWVVMAVVLSTVVEIAISAIFSALTEYTPDKWYNPHRKFYQVSKKEQRFYEKIGIKFWKDHVLELGALGGFRKNKLNGTSSEYMEKFMVESVKGMLGHIIDMFMGFAVIFVLPLKYALRIGLPVAIVGFVLNLLPTLILRYNLPKLNAAYKRAKRLEERAAKETATDTINADKKPATEEK